MKDNSSSSSTYSSPPCPLTAECLLWLDDLDETDNTIQDVFVDQQILRLREHLVSCPTCTMVVKQARQQRDQQRRALRDALLIGEQVVPSTFARIMQAVGQEQQEQQEKKDLLITTEQLPVALLQQKQQSNGHQPGRKRRKETFWRTLVTVAAAAVLLLVSAGTLGPLLLHQLPSPTSRPGIQPISGKTTVPTGTPGTVIIPTRDWQQVLVYRQTAQGLHQPVNYVPSRVGTFSPLIAGCCEADTVFEGISHSGVDYLYHRYVEGKTVYFVLSSRDRPFVVEGKGGNAIWSTDDRFIYTFVDRTILRLDLASRTVYAFPQLKQSISSLTFCYCDSHGSYLYYLRQRSPQQVDLYRLDMQTMQEVLLAQGSSVDPADYWLGPNGDVIYYPGVDGTGNYSAIATTGDGSPQKIPVAGMPVGYTADYSLVVMNAVQGKFQLVSIDKQGTTHVLAQDIAPGAKEISNASWVALSPNASAVVIAGVYGDHTIKLWFKNLQQTAVDAAPQQFASLPADQQLRLIGWDRIQVQKK